MTDGQMRSAGSRSDPASPCSQSESPFELLMTPNRIEIGMAGTHGGSVSSVPHQTAVPDPPLYEIHIIDSQSPSRATTLKSHLSQAIALIGLDDGSVAFLDEFRESSATQPAQRVAIFLANDMFPPSPEAASHLAACLSAEIPVLPIVFALNQCRVVLPKSLSPFNALPWPTTSTGSPTPPPTQDILRFAGLSEADRSVFISYKRSESSAVAEQLLSALVRRGFNVFLDLYSIDYGAEFQTNLKAELASRAMVVLLETAGVTQSKWVMEEINFVRSNKLGLLSVAWSNPAASGNPSPRLLILPADYRMELDPSDFQPGDTGTALVPIALDRVVQEIERTHAVAMARRRRELLGSLSAALRSNSVQVGHLDAWSLVATTPILKEQYQLAVLPRPATVDSVYDCELQRVTAGIPKAFLIQPATGLTGRQVELLGWVTDGRSVACALDTEIHPLAANLGSR
jgi:hypothetical protein